jgi:hypothetical protein
VPKSFKEGGSVMKNRLLLLLVTLLVLPVIGYAKDREISFELVVSTKPGGFNNLAFMRANWDDEFCGDLACPAGWSCCWAEKNWCVKDPINDCPFPPNPGFQTIKTIASSTAGANEIIAFRASKGSGKSRTDGYYLAEKGGTQKILETGDMLFGKKVLQTAIIDQLKCDPPRSVAVYSLFVLFTDLSQAIVKVSIK